MTSAPKRRWLRFSLRTLFVVVTAVAGGALTLYAYREQSRLQAEIFDGEVWRDSTTIHEGVRLTMADGLIARGELRGLSRSAVVEMLGEPPPPEYFQDWDMVYRLGMERSFFSIDSEWLVIRLGADGRVVDYRIVRD